MRHLMLLDFSVGSDGHIQHNPSATKHLLKKIASEKSFFTVLCGDMSENGELSEVKNLLVDINNVYACAGNHDNKTKWQEVFGYNLYRKWEVANWEFYTLYVVTPSSLLVDPLQWGWVNKHFYSSNKPKMVFLHQPPNFIHRWAHHSYDSFYTHEVFKQTNVKAVFCGHIHTFDYEKVDDIDYFITGGLGGIPRNLGNHLPPQKPFHYLYVKINNNDKYDVIMKDINDISTIIV